MYVWNGFTFCYFSLYRSGIDFPCDSYGSLSDTAKGLSRTRFLKLITLFIIYNLCSGLFPDPQYPIDVLTQNVLAYGSGIALATYYFYYLVKELNIQEDRIFNTKFLLSSLSLSFIVGFIVTYLITGDLVLSKLTFIIFPVFIAIYFCTRTLDFLQQTFCLIKFSCNYWIRV